MLSPELLILVNLLGVKCNLRVILSCLSPITKDFEHFYRCFSAIWDSSVVNLQFSSVLHVLVNFLSSLYILDISLLLNGGLVKFFSQSVGCWFILSTMSFALQKLSSFMRSRLSILDLRMWAIGVLFRKFPSVPMSPKFFLTFTSVRLSVSGFMLRILIHLELSIVQGDNCGSVFISLHTDSQLDHRHLLKMLSFFHCAFLASLSNIKCV